MIVTAIDHVRAFRFDDEIASTCRVKLTADGSAEPLLHMASAARFPGEEFPKGRLNT